MGSGGGGGGFQLWFWEGGESNGSKSVAYKVCDFGK